MDISYINIILIMLFAVSFIGYILVIIKEKINLRNNIIIIENKAVTQEHIDEADIKEFVLGGVEVKAGDEVSILLISKKKIEGILIGAKQDKNTIVVVTHDDEVENLKIEKILKFKVISKYGKFFKAF